MVTYYWIGDEDLAIVSHTEFGNIAVISKHSVGDKVCEWAKRLVRALNDSERLRKALEFYADVSKYPAPFTGGMGELWSDCGQVAREALNDETF